MSVTIDYNGNIGNCLFQYVFARLLAENNEMYLQTPFPYQRLIQTTPHRSGRIFSNPIVIHEEPYFSETLFYTNLDAARRIPVDFYDLLTEPLSEANHVLRGYFEYSKIYDENFETIKTFFRLDPIDVNYADIVINIRLGDFGKFGRVISPEWYLRILEQEQFERLFIVGCEAGEEYLVPFQKYEPVVIPSTPFGDFHTIRSFNRVICSNSTFCWWAAFLGEASKIYIPDQWLSPNVDSCKESILIECDQPISYSSRFKYKHSDELRPLAAQTEIVVGRFICVASDVADGILNSFILFLDKIWSRRNDDKGLFVCIDVGKHFVRHFILGYGELNSNDKLPCNPDIYIRFFDWRTCIDYFIYNEKIVDYTTCKFIAVASDIARFYPKIELNDFERFEFHRALSISYHNGSRLSFEKINCTHDFCEILRNGPVILLAIFSSESSQSGSIQVVLSDQIENGGFSDEQLMYFGLDTFGFTTMAELVANFVSFNDIEPEYVVQSDEDMILCSVANVRRYIVNSLDMILRYFSEFPCRSLIINDYLIYK